MRTCGSVLKADQRFWGRSVSWISEVFNSVLDFISMQWVPPKIQSFDTRVFSRWRIHDYARNIWAWNIHTSAYRISVENGIGNIHMRCVCLQNNILLEPRSLKTSFKWLFY